MPKARNQQTEQAIRSAAWRLFFDRGFAATSYTDLAEASGVSRSLVQRYVPKKELLVGWCVAEIRRAATEVCDEAYPQRLGPLERLYLRGQASIAAYFACEGIGRLMLDVLSSRELTHQTIVEGFRWTVEQTLPDRPELHDIDEPDEIVMATGGLYELVYVYLLKGRTPDVAARARRGAGGLRDCPRRAARSCPASDRAHRLVTHPPPLVCFASELSQGFRWAYTRAAKGVLRMHAKRGGWLGWRA